VDGRRRKADGVTAAPLLTVEQIPIDQLRPDPANPRRISGEELDALERSIREFGFVQLLGDLETREKRERPSPSILALIHDQNVTDWFMRYAGVDLPCSLWSESTYGDYLDRMHDWASRLACRPDDLELRIFEATVEGLLARVPGNPRSRHAPTPRWGAGGLPAMH
jgi:hypothetical protein